ncbi:adenine deaminase [Enterococcus termitis]
MKKELVMAALGDVEIDLVLKNGYVLNMFTEEIIKTDVAIKGDTIVGMGKYSGKLEIDCTGKYISPGFIDAHMHIESSMVSPIEFSKIVMKKGTTTVISDPHEIVNVLGRKGLEYMISATENVPINVFIMIPSSVPAADIDTNGAGEFSAMEMLEYKSHPRILGLAEVMRVSDVINLEKICLRKLIYLMIW